MYSLTELKYRITIKNIKAGVALMPLLTLQAICFVKSPFLLLC